MWSWFFFQFSEKGNIRKKVLFVLIFWILVSEVWSCCQKIESPVIKPTINPIEIVNVEELFSFESEFVIVEDVTEAGVDEGVDEGIIDEGVDGEVVAGVVEGVGEGAGTAMQLHFETLLQSVKRLLLKSLHI